MIAQQRMSRIEPLWLLALAAVAAVAVLACACAIGKGDEPASKPANPLKQAANTVTIHGDVISLDAKAAERGYRFLVDKAYITPDFSEEVFADAWQKWPEPLRSEAEKASPQKRREMAFERYGLTPRPDDPTKPLQYVVDEKGNWTLNCFGCHGGQVGGKVWPGLPNSRIALETLTEETRALKIERDIPLSRFDLGLAFVPLGSSDGSTNAVMFGVVLMALRDKDLNVLTNRPPPLENHDMDAIPWWHFKHKTRLYVDNFAPKGHRGLMQFMLIRQNGPEKFRTWAKDFADVYAYINSVHPPEYPHAVDAELAGKGRVVFERHCSECHGRYGPRGDNGTTVVEWPERVVPIDDVKTDRKRLDALSPAGRKRYGDSWFNDYGNPPAVAEPVGYVAPPLEGVWASAPYFHNGSVPTLWHVLNPEARPSIWKRTATGYDEAKVGLETETMAELPADAATTAWKRRQIFDTRVPGKSAAGHDYPNRLNESEKREVLEYLKTL